MCYFGYFVCFKLLYLNCVANCIYSDEIPEMIAHCEPLQSCFVLTDPQDPRYKFVTGLRHRFGRFLRNASDSLRKQGEENTIDAVHVLVCSLSRMFV